MRYEKTREKGRQCNTSASSSIVIQVFSGKQRKPELCRGQPRANFRLMANGMWHADVNAMHAGKFAKLLLLNDVYTLAYIRANFGL